MFNRIMIPLDGSELAEAALPIAKRIALALDSEVHLVSVPEDELTVSQRIVGYTWIGAEKRLEDIREERRAYLAEVKERFSAENIPTHTKLLKGDVATALIEYASAIEADLVVMCTHGRTGLTRWALGSIAERVTRKLDRPLLLVREDTTLNHFLVALDGSLAAEQLVPPALNLRAIFNAKLTLFYARDTERPPYLAHPEAYLEKIISTYCHDSQSINYLIRAGAAAETIIHTADMISADLICLTTRGLHNSRWEYGRVTARVLQKNQAARFILPINRN